MLGGSSWRPFGAGLDNDVYALAIYNGELIAGGSFTTAGGTTVHHIARWNGSSWQPLGTGMDFDVYALTVYNGELIAGGGFTTAGGVDLVDFKRFQGCFNGPNRPMNCAG